jgi:hypothetical protein
MLHGSFQTLRLGRSILLIPPKNQSLLIKRTLQNLYISSSREIFCRKALNTSRSRGQSGGREGLPGELRWTSWIISSSSSSGIVSRVGVVLSLATFTISCGATSISKRRSEFLAICLTLCK